MPDSKKGEAFSRLVLKCWSDPGFKAQLHKDPMPLLKEYGVEVPAGMKVKIVENEPGTIALVLPAAPSGPSAAKEDGVYTIMCSVCYSRDSCLTHHG